MLFHQLPAEGYCCPRCGVDIRTNYDRLSEAPSKVNCTEVGNG